MRTWMAQMDAEAAVAAEVAALTYGTTPAVDVADGMGLQAHALLTSMPAPT